jgi:hypothetical protein
MTTTQPSSGYVKPVGRAISSSQFFFSIEVGWLAA